MQDNSPSQALSPFLPLLPGFLIGVRLSAAEWPSHDIEGFLDVTSDSDVNLHTLVEELGVQAEAAPADRKSSVILYCHSCRMKICLQVWLVVMIQLTSDSRV